MENGNGGLVVYRLSWVAGLTGIAFAGLGLVFVVLGVTFSLLDSRRLSRGG